METHHKTASSYTSRATIERYVNGKMTDEEVFAFEIQLTRDPFLKEAVLGYIQHPHAQRVLKTKHSLPSKSWIWAALTITALTVVAILYQWPTNITSENHQNVLVDSSEYHSDTVNYNAIKDAVIQEKSEVQMDEQSTGNPFELVTQERYVIPKVSVLSLKPKTSPSVKPLASNHTNLLAKHSGPIAILADHKVLDYTRFERKITTSTDLDFTTYVDQSVEPRLENSQDSIPIADAHHIEVDEEYMKYLESALELLRLEDNDAAVLRFKRILQTFPNDQNALFYLGVCYYNMYAYKEALIKFEEVQAQLPPIFDQEARWKKAKCLIALKRQKEAIPILTQISTGDGFYSEQASKLLESFPNE